VSTEERVRPERPTLITGGAGFIGSNLADALLGAGEPVIVVDNLARPGVASNLGWLRERHGDGLRFEPVDVRDARRLEPLVREAGRVYHLAAQVAVTASIADPASDFTTNLVGTFNLLEAARRAAEPPPLLYTSTNKVYGSLESLAVERTAGGYRWVDGRAAIDEEQPLDFHAPYGCSKGAADQYVRDYARVYGMSTGVFRMSCIYGTRQFGTEDQGWVAHFARSLLDGRPITVFGDGYQVRDILWVGDLIDAMRAAMHRLERGGSGVFNVGGGPEHSVTIREVIGALEEIIGRRTEVIYAPWRPGDQRVFISDTSRARTELGWRATVDWSDGLERLVDWLVTDRARDVAAPRPRVVGMPG
jgi:CDP-paratose 2-epimerase